MAMVKSIISANRCEFQPKYIEALSPAGAGKDQVWLMLSIRRSTTGSITVTPSYAGCITPLTASESVD